MARSGGKTIISLSSDMRSGYGLASDTLRYLSFLQYSKGLLKRLTLLDHAEVLFFHAES